MNSKNILFMPDAINSADSGAQSARATLNFLQQLGHSVAVYARDADAPTHREIRPGTALYKIPTLLRWYEHVYSPTLLDDFARIVGIVNPGYVFFAGSRQKPAVLSREARRRKIRTVFLFYINDYYCVRVYSGLADGPCTRCINRTRLSALFNRCVRFLDIPNWAIGEITRCLLGKEIKKCFKMLGYGNDQLEIARQYGVKNNNLALVGFQFDPAEVSGVPVSDKGYFALTGQPLMQKGWHLLQRILSGLRSKPLIKVSFRDMATARCMIERYGLASFVESGLVEVITGLIDRSRYLEFMASSRAVIIPSYYPTTGEFVLQESMLLGKPVHVFDVGVHKDMLIDRQNAMVSAVGDLEDYARKIDEIEWDLSLRSSIGNAARTTANGFYDSGHLKMLDDVFI